MFKFLLVPNWVSSSFPVIQAILLAVITLCSLAVIVAALLNPSDPEGGNNVITGKNESYYGHNKGNTKEGILHKIILIGSITILVCAIIYFVTVKIFNGLGA